MRAPVCMYVYRYVYVCVYVCTHVYACVIMYIGMYACVCMYMCAVADLEGLHWFQLKPPFKIEAM